MSVGGWGELERQQEGQGRHRSVGSEGIAKAEMGGTGGTMDGAGLRQTKLHKTQEDEQKKMRGEDGGEPKTDGKGRAQREGEKRRRGRGAESCC